VNSDEEVKMFLNQKTQNEDGNTPLHIASFEGDIQMMKMLIDLGAEVS